MKAPETDARFLACLAQTLKWEGGYSNDPYDPGGATYHGIIQREYDAYRVNKGLPKQTVRKMSKVEEDEIYFNGYWDETRCDELPAGVDLCVFDFAVNSGPVTSVKKLQLAVNVKPDGKIGPITLAAIESMDPDEIVTELMALRRSYLKSLKTYWRFGKGWMNRCDGIERMGLLWGGSDHIMAAADIPAAVPHEVPDMQAASQARAYDPAPSNAAQTPTGKVAIVSGGTGGLGVCLQVGHAAQASYSGGHFDLIQFALILLASEAFWVSAGLIGGAIVAWLERHKLIKQEAR
jgi:lysozyme family protein